MVEVEDVTILMLEVTIVIRNFIFFFSLVFVFTVNISYSKESKDKEEIKEVIKMYNHMVIQASKSRRVPNILMFKDMMSDFTTGRVAEKLYIWIMSWHENNLYMDAKLLDIKFKNITINDKNSVAFTTEKWIYKYIDAVNNVVAHPDTEVIYNMRYDLLKVDNKWKINKIKILSQNEKILEDKEGK